MFDFNDISKITDEAELVGKLIDLAKSGKKAEFEFIRSLQGLKAAKAVRKALRGVAEMFARLADGVEREYAVGVLSGNALLELLRPLYDFRRSQSFYEEELSVTEDMISEYRTYLRSGRWLKALFGFERTESELVDFRSIPLTLF